jgi:DNA-binding transcriptional regulator YiaG
MAKDLPCFTALVTALEAHPRLAESFDAEAIQIIVPERYTPKIKDLAKVISHFKRYVAINKDRITVIAGEQVITREQLAKMLGISRQTLTDWIKKGFISPQSHSRLKRMETFDTNAVLEQLKRLENE